MLIEMKIADISMDPFLGVPIVYLQEAIHKTHNLSVWIGVFEAKAIAVALNGSKSNRPFPYDVLMNILKLSDLKITRVIISDLIDNTFYGVVEVVNDKGEVTQIDSRVSDALAIGVRAGVRIFTTDLVLKKVHAQRKGIKEKGSTKDLRQDPPPSPPEKMEKDKLEDWLKNLKPEDFKNA